MDIVSSVETIREGLDIEAHPVGVTFTDDEPPVEAKSGFAVCQGILATAEDGSIVELSKESCACAGGVRYLGFLERTNTSRDMLVEEEKLWHTVNVAYRAGEQTDDIAEPPVGLADRVYLFPATEPVFRPDLVVFVVDAEQVSRLVLLDQYWDGRSPSMEMHGSMCWSTITYPFVTGKMNVSAGEISARDLAEWPAQLLTVTIPAERLETIAAAVPKSTAGTADRSPQYLEHMDRMRKDRSTE